jgi:3-dehydroquinate synthase
LAEIIKYGIIGDHNLFEFLEHEIDGIKQRKPSLLQSLVGRSCKIKADIVETDEKELGLRRILNFGHTLGHALEAASDFTLSHGEAVSIGMAGAAKISYNLEYLAGSDCDRIVDLLTQYNLPVKIPAGMETAKITGFMATDKKAVAGQLHFVLVKDIGVPFVTPDVPLRVVTETIEELRG